MSWLDDLDSPRLAVFNSYEQQLSLAAFFDGGSSSARAVETQGAVANFGGGGGGGGGGLGDGGMGLGGGAWLDAGAHAPASSLGLDGGSRAGQPQQQSFVVLTGVHDESSSAAVQDRQGFYAGSPEPLPAFAPSDTGRFAPSGAGVAASSMSPCVFEPPDQSKLDGAFDASLAVENARTETLPPQVAEQMLLSNAFLPGDRPGCVQPQGGAVFKETPKRALNRVVSGLPSMQKWRNSGGVKGGSNVPAAAAVVRRRYGAVYQDGTLVHRYHEYTLIRRNPDNEKLWIENRHSTLFHVLRKVEEGKKPPADARSLPGREGGAKVQRLAGPRTRGVSGAVGRRVWRDE